MYVPLKITTEYSLLKSTIRIDELISFLLKNNITSCAICDYNLYGVMEFYNKMLENNLKPIIGLEIKIDGHILYLYAKNDHGYRNLLKIHTLKEMENIKTNSLNNYLSDIKIVLPYKSYEMLNEFPYAYLGYQNQEEKIEASIKSKNILYLKEICSLYEEETKYLKILEGIDKGILLKDISSIKNDCYFHLDINPDDEKTTKDFISDIDIKIINKENYIPKYQSDIDSFTYLNTLAHKGLLKRLNNKLVDTYVKRLEYELKVIKQMGFVDYFLIVYDYVFYAKKNNILVGPGRGSAAGSLVSYCLGITDVDPLKYNLLFERFLNPERITMPDIDIDFEYTKRGEVVNYVRNRYGFMNVAPIMTFGTLGSKQVIRDVARVMNIKIELVDKLAKIIDAKLSLKENLKNKEVLNFVNTRDDLKALYSNSIHLEGLKRHISTHAAGVVISSVALDEVIPITYNGEFITTGLTMEYLEPLGLLKMDFLALRNLTIIANVLDLIKKNTGQKVDLNRIDLNDQSVFKLFSSGDTEGIFQYESSGMRNLMLKLKPSTFSDLVASVALFRPGPMHNINSFIARKFGQEKITYYHSDLEPILKETYGIIVYQEQVIQILVKIGGYTYAEADNIRRAMSKKKESVMLKDKEHFIKNAVHNGYSEGIAIKIYNLILKFANYGFNKAHSVSYALIGYQMAYLKVKAPLYFILNLLNMSIGSEIKTKEYVSEAREKNILLIKPDINESEETYKIINNKLMFPLTVIKNLGTMASLSILEERRKNGKYTDYLQFVSRVYGKSVNKKTLISLILAGVLDSFSLTKKTMVENLDVAINYADLINNLDESLIIKPELENFSEYDEEFLRKKELESYGFYITNHPVSKYSSKSIIKNELAKDYFDKRINNVVLVEKIRSIKTKKGENMAFITASDETGNMEYVIFPKCYYMLTNIRIGDIITIQGLVTKRFGSYVINVDLIQKNNEGGMYA